MSNHQLKAIVVEGNKGAANVVSSSISEYQNNIEHTDITKSFIEAKQLILELKPGILLLNIQIKLLLTSLKVFKYSL